MLVVGVVLLGAAPGSSWAQRSPSPRELWNAYPLDPDSRELIVKQAPPPVASAAAPSPSSSGAGDDLGLLAGVAIALAAAAFTAGLVFGRRRREPATAVAVNPASERRVVWRVHPPPLRPAPPPPPLPGREGRR